MDDMKKIYLLEQLSGEKDADVLSTYLLLAESKVLAHLYPFGAKGKTIPEEYQMNVLEIAAFLISKIGQEGEVVHSENGVSRTFESGDIPKEMLQKMIPFAEVC